MPTILKMSEWTKSPFGFLNKYKGQPLALGMMGVFATTAVFIGYRFFIAPAQKKRRLEQSQAWAEELFNIEQKKANQER
uniref:Uncharacterized protein n=1 Tax=Timema bartmani TaxID=61472 RepID=A0A7R9F8D2_9NEOP|nr:unnamed protein product [Timema bartmani]